MAQDGERFFDDHDVFKTYQAHRERSENPNDTLEKPILLELVGELAGKRILDLGCGDAAFGREAFTKGCREYIGLESSTNMVAAARSMLAGTTGQVVQTTLQAWNYPADAFDLVISRLTLHYIEDVETIFRAVYQTLSTPGQFVLSVEHPVITSCDRAWQGQGLRQDWIVDNYFEHGRRVVAWLGGQVVKYHRTVEDYFLGMRRTGFSVEQLRESEPQHQWFVSEETFQRRKRIPLFLFVSGCKR